MKKETKKVKTETEKNEEVKTKVKPSIIKKFGLRESATVLME